MALIAAATLVPRSGAATRWAWAGESAAADAVLNVMLFVPLGLSLGSPAVRPLRVAGVGLLISLTIEVSQLLFIPGRTASPLDLIANAAGSWLGASLAFGRLVSLSRSPRVAPSVLILAIGAWLGQAAIVAWVQHPSAPLTPAYHGQWAHIFPGTVSLPYRVSDATVNGQRTPDGPISTTVALRHGIEREGMHLQVQTDALTAVAGRAQLFGLADGLGHQVANVDASGCDLVFDAYTRAARLRLHSPRLRLTAACSPSPAPTVVEASQDGRTMRLAMGREGGPATSARLELSPLRGWALLLPIAVDPADDRLATAVWILLTVLPIGLLAAMRLPRVPMIGPIAGAILLVGTVLLAWLFGAAAPDALQAGWLVAVSWAGALAAPRLRRLTAGSIGEHPGPWLGGVRGEA